MMSRLFKSFLGFGVLLIAVGVVLFGESLISPRGLEVLRSVAVEVRAVCRDPGTQWMVFLCAGIYFLTFTILGKNRKQKGESRGRKSENSKPETRNPKRTFNHQLSTFNLQPADVWLCALLLIAALHYAFHYEKAATSTQALMLMVGAAIGKAARLWAMWGVWKHPTSNVQDLTSNEGKAERGTRSRESSCARGSGGQGGEHSTFNIQHSTSKEAEAEAADRKSQIVNHKSAKPATCNLQRLLFVLLLLLAVAALWQPEGAMQFQYRGLNRWSGPWDNPNIFGLLMGVGVVLAAGLLIQGSKFNVRRFKVSSFCGLWSVVPWSRGLFVLTCGTVCAIGLLKSYSRGAWLGTLCGLGFLIYQVAQDRADRRSPDRRVGKSQRERLGEENGAAAADRKSSIINRKFRHLFTHSPIHPCNPFNRFNSSTLHLLSVLLLSVVILSYWHFRHTEFHPVRRAFSVGNQNDFSWRNRVAAWEGALAMMADRPVTGFGWNQPERVYDQFYRPAKVSEGMAIQLNHYFTLGMSLGLPALICFAAYVGFSFTRRETNLENPEERPIENRKSEIVNRPNLQLPAVCRAAAVVLLVGLWFDGGLFNLATSALLWALLELGKVGRVTPCAPSGPPGRRPSG